MQTFEGKRVMVTGGSRGIGESIARHFVDLGARVAIVARNPERAQSTAESLGGETRAFAADVSDENAVNETVGSIVEAWDGIDVLINNAGITRDNLLMRDEAGGLGRRHVHEPFAACFSARARS